DLEVDGGRRVPGETSDDRGIVILVQSWACGLLYQSRVDLFDAGKFDLSDGDWNAYFAEAHALNGTAEWSHGLDLNLRVDASRLEHRLQLRGDQVDHLSSGRYRPVEKRDAGV